MRVFRNTRRAVLLIASLLSACAAADPAADMEGVKPASGVSGNYLAGRFALNSCTRSTTFMFWKCAKQMYRYLSRGASARETNQHCVFGQHYIGH